MPPTPQYQWAMLNQRLKVDLWLKHENHTPLGAFKVRGGLVYFSETAKSPEVQNGVVTATRGNHGQSVAFAAAQYGISTTVVVPYGNSKEKNAAMIALGATLIEHGTDFQDAIDYANNLVAENGLYMVPSFDPLLVAGVSTYGLELFRAVENLDVVYVPIGMGSGICGLIAARKALKLDTEIVGVVSSEALAYSKSFAEKKLIESPVTTKIADGMACRKPNATSLDCIVKEIDRIVEVTDAEIKLAMRDIFECTHNVAEGAGAASVAAASKEQDRLVGKRAAAIISGGNVDREVFQAVIS